MTWIEAILLGIVQGITEFFPVSSSGHLTLFQHFLGLKLHEDAIAFDLVCHLGTLAAILTVFYKQMRRLIATRWQQVVCATLPLFPLALIVKPVKALFHDPKLLGFCFLFTALILFISRNSSALPKFKRKPKRLRDSLLIGLSQAVAILPGISRSGATISTARLIGWSVSDATTFSFLLAIPAILGGAVLETLHLLKATHHPQIFAREYCLGFFFSFMVGYATLQTLRKMIIRNEIMGFVWYCVAIGIISLIYFY